MVVVNYHVRHRLSVWFGLWSSAILLTEAIYAQNLEKLYIYFIYLYEFVFVYVSIWTFHVYSLIYS